MARQISKLTEEIGFLRAKQSAGLEVGDSKEASILRSTLSALETRFREVKELYTNQKREIEETQFECETLKSTVERLKNECQDSSDRETGERKQRHTLEMTVIELRKKLSETCSAQKETEEAFKQALSELGVMKGELNQHGEMLKSERRKALSLDRELEQSKFLAERKDKEHRDNIEMLNHQLKNFKVENEGLLSRIEQLTKDMQSRTAKDGRESSNLTIRVRELEAKENNLIICLEDTQKKLAFYKEKATRKDYESVSKNSILEKIASLLHFVSSIRESWETEKFIMRQEMSCMASLISQMADTYYQSLKPKQLRKHFDQNISSKIFSKYMSDRDGSSVTFGAQSLTASERNDQISGKSSLLKRVEEELSSFSTKITPKKPTNTNAYANTSKFASSPPEKKEILPSWSEITAQGPKVPKLPLKDYSKPTDRPGGFEQAFNILQESTNTRSLQHADRPQTSREQASDFIARINAKVMDKTRPESFAGSVKTPVKLANTWKEDLENVNPNMAAFMEFSLGPAKEAKRQSTGEDKIDYQKIEKESEEIAKRIQALKLKDFSYLK